MQSNTFINTLNSLNFNQKREYSENIADEKKQIMLQLKHILGERDFSLVCQVFRDVNHNVISPMEYSYRIKELIPIQYYPLYNRLIDLMTQNTVTTANPNDIKNIQNEAKQTVMKNSVILSNIQSHNFVKMHELNLSSCDSGVRLIEIPLKNELDNIMKQKK